MVFSTKMDLCFKHPASAGQPHYITTVIYILLRMNSLKSYFPGIKNITYLNTPASGPLPAPVSAWRSEMEQFLLNSPDAFRAETAPILGETRTQIAAFIHTDAENIALVPNFSFGFNTLLEGLPAGAKILMLEGDYPSITWPVEKRDFQHTYIKADAGVEQRLADAVKEFKPHAVVLSIVQWTTGIKIDLDILKQIKAAHPEVLFIADGTQYLGTEAFDFEDSPFDVLISSAYKWMLAGFGNGFVAVKEAARKHFDLKTAGLNSADSLAGSLSDIRFMKHFEPGHLNALDFGSITKALGFTQELGQDTLYGHLSNLTRAAKEQLSELGLLHASAAKRNNHSTIFSLQAGDEVFETLIKENISCTQRGGGIRVGFHFFNDEQDLERLINVLKAVL